MINLAASVTREVVFRWVECKQITRLPFSNLTLLIANEHPQTKGARTHEEDGFQRLWADLQAECERCASPKLIRTLCGDFDCFLIQEQYVLHAEVLRKPRSVISYPGDDEIKWVSLCEVRRFGFDVRLEGELHRPSRYLGLQLGRIGLLGGGVGLFLGYTYRLICLRARGTDLFQLFPGHLVLAPSYDEGYDGRKSDHTVSHLEIDKRVMKPLFERHDAASLTLRRAA